MQWQTIFDITKANWAGMLVIFLLPVGGLAMAWVIAIAVKRQPRTTDSSLLGKFHAHFQERSDLMAPILPFITIAFCLALLGLSYWRYNSWKTLNDAYINSRCEQLEGTVHNLRMDSSRSKVRTLKFAVDGREIAVTETFQELGFSPTAPRLDELKNDQKVRLWLSGSSIVRLDVER